MLALDVVRLEAGLILLEVDYTSARHAMNPEQNYSPGEIGLGRLVSLDKADFVGRLALERERAAGGPKRRLVGLQLAWNDIEGLFSAQGLPPAISPVVDRSHRPVFVGGRQVGRATSVGWSPILKQAIALASVPPSPRRPAPTSTSSGPSRAAAAGSRARSSRCRSSTWSASARRPPMRVRAAAGRRSRVARVVPRPSTTRCASPAAASWCDRSTTRCSIAETDDGQPAGLLTYIERDGECEILTLHAVRQWSGAGSALIAAIRDLAASHGCRRLWVVTTNDNVDALRFYQRRGFRLAAAAPRRRR